MSIKDLVAKKITELFTSLGIDPMIGSLFIGLLLGIITIKDIKNWKNISHFSKIMDLAIWFGLFTIILAIIVRSVRGY